MTNKATPKWMYRIIAIFTVLVILAVALLLVESHSYGTDSHAGIELDCFKNNMTDQSYDSSLFYRNDLNVFGGDADVIYVSKEQSSEYGGYFYMYTSGNDTVDLENYGTYKSVITCLRSKDMNNWELCGQNGGEDGIVGEGEGNEITAGFCVWIDKDEWIQSHVWAPEVIYNENDGKYYMYTNAFGPYSAAENGFDEEYNMEANPANNFDRFYGAVLISETPVGPFKLATSERYYGLDETGNPKENLNGKVIYGKTPQINVKIHFGMDEIFSAIDFSPFFDEKGDLYLYFVRHISTGHNHNCIWGVKMKDMITPDYDTLTMLAACNYQTVTKKDSTLSVWDEDAYNLTNKFPTKKASPPIEDLITGEQVKYSDKKFKGEGTINEAPQMIEKDGRYYLCYSPLGYDNSYYDVCQAIGEKPLGPFKKLQKYPGTVLGRNETADEMTGTGHPAFVEAGGELFCVYYVHADPNDGSTSDTDGRIYAFDRVSFVEVDGYGTLLYGNGPTKSVQPTPVVASGVRNIASEATIVATNVDTDTLKYANDGVFVTHDYYADWELSTTGPTEITIAFDEPRNIRGIMVYNSIHYNMAFSKIDSIEFDLAETPMWYMGADDNRSAYIPDIPFNTDYVNQEDGYMRAGGAAMASFNEIKVNSIKITISEKFDDTTSQIGISDIVVLGN